MIQLLALCPALSKKKRRSPPRLSSNSCFNLRDKVTAVTCARVVSSHKGYPSGWNAAVFLTGAYPPSKAVLRSKRLHRSQTPATLYPKPPYPKPALVGCPSAPLTRVHPSHNLLSSGEEGVGQMSTDDDVQSRYPPLHDEKGVHRVGNHWRRCSGRVI